MDSIFDNEHVAALASRIDKLKPDSKAQWGKMNVSQMLAHCVGPLQVGTGEHKLGKYNIFMRAIGRMVKKSLVKDDKPYGKNKPTDESFTGTDVPDFEQARKTLKINIQQFSEAGKTHKLHGEHPFFGRLTEKEWDTMAWKHLDHHLRQFGV